MNQPLLLASIVVTFASCKACEMPAVPDAGALAGKGEPCETVWDCAIGLACQAKTCADLPRPPDAMPGPDAAVDDAADDDGAVDDAAAANDGGAANDAGAANDPGAAGDL